MKLKRKILYGVIRYRIADCMCKMVNLVLKCIFLLPRLLRLERVKKFEENVIKKNKNLFCRVFKSYGLICALKEGNIEVATKLIEKGANPNIWNGRNVPLTYACSGEMEDIANELIEKGANVNCEDIDGYTPLLLACINGMESPANKLIEKGANINYVKNGYTPLLWACINGIESTANKLIEKGVNINCVKDGYTPLLLACINGMESTANKLIEKGANINCVKNGYTPLLWACVKGMESTVEMLIDRGAKVRTGSKYVSKEAIFDVTSRAFYKSSFPSRDDIKTNEMEQITQSIECINNTRGSGVLSK